MRVILMHDRGSTLAFLGNSDNLFGYVKDSERLMK